MTAAGEPGADRVEVLIRRRILKPEILDFLFKIDKRYALTQRERIALGVLVQHEALAVRDLADILEIEDLGRHPGSAHSWIRERIGIEIPEHRIRRQAQAIEAEGLLGMRENIVGVNTGLRINLSDKGKGKSRPFIMETWCINL